MTGIEPLTTALRSLRATPVRLKRSDDGPTVGPHLCLFGANEVGPQDAARQAQKQWGHEPTLESGDYEKRRAWTFNTKPTATNDDRIDEPP